MLQVPSPDHRQVKMCEGEEMAIINWNVKKVKQTEIKKWIRAWYWDLIDTLHNVG